MVSDIQDKEMWREDRTLGYDNSRGVMTGPGKMVQEMKDFLFLKKLEINLT